MAEQYFMGLDGFIWFVGVVENRNDPAELGRVQVRCLGYHTEDLTLIPTADLPWAHVMHPVTDPSMQGLGSTPSFLVEGSWVVGFFRDAREKQQPIIMGTLPGYPEDLPDTKYGFNDPTGTYPSEKRSNSDHGLKESDVSRLARGKDSEEHSSLIKRRKIRQGGEGKRVPTATVPYNSKTDNTQQGREKRNTWDEPNPKSVAPDESPYTSAKYPYNHVHESEAGHIHEIDDTPGGERLMQQHSSGTFTEIHPDGSKVVKVIGDNYEIIAGKSSILVVGDATITYDGNVRQLIKKDYVLEVMGDYSEKIHKNKRMKVGAGKEGGNLYEEVNGNRSSNVNRHVKSRVGMDFITEIEGSDLTVVQGAFNVLSMDGIVLNSAVKSLVLTAQKDITMVTGLGSIDIKAATTASMAGVDVTNLGGKAIILGDLTTVTQTHLSSGVRAYLAAGTYNIIAANIALAGLTTITPSLSVAKTISAGISMKSPGTLFGTRPYS